MPQDLTRYIVDGGPFSRFGEQEIRQFGPLNPELLSYPFHPGEKGPADFLNLKTLLLTQIRVQRSK